MVYLYMLIVFRGAPLAFSTNGGVYKGHLFSLSTEHLRGPKNVLLKPPY